MDTDQNEAAVILGNRIAGQESASADKRWLLPVWIHLIYIAHLKHVKRNTNIWIKQYKCENHIKYKCKHST